MVKSACLPATPCALLVEMLPFLDKEEKTTTTTTTCSTAAQPVFPLILSHSLSSLLSLALFVNASVNLGDIFTFAFRPCLRSLWRSLSQFLLLFVYFLIIIALCYNCPWPHTQRERHTDTFTQRVDKLRAQQRGEKLQTNRTLSMDMCVCVCVYICLRVCGLCVIISSCLAPARAWLSNLISLAAHSKSW